MLAQSLGLIHPYGASTVLRRQFIKWAQESSTTLHFFSGQLARFRDAYVESSNPSLFCDETDSISNSQNTLFRQFCFCCGKCTHAELVDVVHHTLEGPTRIWCLRRLALCEIWPASLKVPRPSPSTTKSCSRKALWACIDVFVRFSQTDEVVSPKVTAEGLSTKLAKSTTTVRERPFLAPSRSLRNLVARCVPPRSDRPLKHGLTRLTQEVRDFHRKDPIAPCALFSISHISCTSKRTTKYAWAFVQSMQAE